MAGKSKGQPRAYLLRGDDDVRKQASYDQLIASLVAPDFADFDFEQMTGDTATSDKVMAGLHVPPFSSAQRVVSVRYANKMIAEEQKKLAIALPGAPASGCLIMTVPAPERKEGKVTKGSDVVGELSRAIRKVGEVRDFAKMKDKEATAFAAGLFKKAGKNIHANALATFVQRAGTDSSVLVSEAQKLVDYSEGKDEITRADVDAVTSETPEERMFAMIDAVANHSQGQALRLLDELFAAGQNPDADAPRTLAMIARHYRMLWQCRMLIEANVKTLSASAIPEEIKAVMLPEPDLLGFAARQSWAVPKLMAQARAMSRQELTRCFEALAQTDMMLKGIEGNVEDSRIAMELLVLDLARPPERS